MKNKPVMKEQKPRRHIEWGRLLFTPFLIVSVAAGATMQAFAAGTDMWSKATEIMKDVYNQILLISTIAGAAKGTAVGGPYGAAAGFVLGNRKLIGGIVIAVIAVMLIPVVLICMLPHFETACC